MKSFTKFTSMRFGKSRSVERVLLLSGLLIATAGCDKKLFDYRNEYVDQWEFTTSREEFDMVNGVTFSDTVSGYNGMIRYGENKDEIKFYYTDQDVITLKLDKNGTLSGFPTSYCSGYFDGKKNVHLYLRWGGLGGGIIHVVDGKR